MRELVRDLALALRERVLPHLGSGHEFQMSVVAAGNQVVHRAILEALDAGFARVSG